MVTQIDINAERVLYWIDKQDESQPTRNILDRFSHIQETRIRSKLDTLRKCGLVETHDKNEYAGASRNTNFYKSTNLVDEYRSQYGLAIPCFELREENEDWRVYQEEHLETYEKKYRDMKQQNKSQAQRIRQLEQQNKQLKNRVERLEEGVFDDGDEDDNQEGEIMNEI
jgi:hypothetical protein